MYCRLNGSSLRPRLIRSVLVAHCMCVALILCLAGASPARASSTGKAGIAFSLYAASGAPGATVTLRTLVYSGGAPVSGLNIEFAVDGVAAGSGTSDATGAACSYTIPSSMAVGVYNVTVSFAGDASHYAASRTTAALTVKVVKANVALSLYPARGLPGTGVLLKSLVYSKGAPASGLSVQFAVDGVAAGSTTSDAVCASLAYTIPSTMVPGAHNVTASFAGDATHNPTSRTTVALTVRGGGLQPLSPWPMFRQNARHTGAAIGGAAAGNLKWSYATGGGDSSPAIAADGTTYVGSFDTYVYALKPGDGSLKWRFKTGDWVHSSPAIGADGTVYVGSNDGYLYALNPADGSLKWAFETGASVRSSPAIGADGTVYVGSDDTYVYAINPRDGSQKWSFQTGDEVFSSPAIGADGTVYVGSDDHFVYAINPADGSQKWSVETGWLVESSPAVGTDGTVYIGSQDNYVYALSPLDGSTLWKFPAGQGVDSSPAIGSDGTIYVGSYDYYVYAINPLDGTQVWRAQTGNWVTSSPSIGTDGTVYIGSWDRSLYALAPSDGSQKWTFPTGDVVQASPAIGADGTIYIGSADDYLYAVK